MTLTSALQQAAELITQADALIITAGAGMGVDSGLPDFRGSEGFWNAYPALGRRNLVFHEIANPAAFRRDLRLAWGFYGHRLQLYRNTMPHKGFGVLKKWAEKMPHGYQVFTSNVDGQFQAAGYDEQRIHECHGSIHHLQCLLPCRNAIWSAQDFLPEIDTQQCQLLNAAPTCPHCGGIARPNILMFGDAEWLEQRQQQQQARQASWLATVSRPLVIELGAGTAIPTVRHFSHRLLHEHHGRLIRINLREPQVPTSLDVGLAVGALDALTALDALL
ncbi:SIR2 family NAD-dependent protein deacylase [Undibacterium sp. SXout7W]|uniref:SIR2 family NAD-dependent protein deacylase n=1 Tax=Undibacterium sp. SXout7W TaxID=3413049 RepID=UPI003BF336CB